MASVFVIIDGNSLLHRGYHAIPHLVTSSGQPTGAIFGFTTIFLKVLQELSPQYVAVTFDTAKPTFRHKKFPAYKAQRPEMAELLVAQLPSVQELVRVFGCPIFEKPGYEADDVIGTLVQRIRQEHPELTIYIVTGDMDTLQLVDEKTIVYTSRRGLTDTILYDPASVRKRYGFEPQQMIDYKALRGDPSDNIPGVHGIGEKTAMELVQRFGSLEAIYQQYQGADIKERTKQLLLLGQEQAFLSKELVTLDQTVPLQFDLAMCAFHENFDRERVVQLFKKLEFTSLVKKIPPSSASPISKEFPADKTTKIIKEPVHYQLIAHQEQFQEFINKLKTVKAFAFDTETNSRNVHHAELVGLSFAWKKGAAVYVAFNQPQHDMQQIRQQWLSVLKPYFENKAIAKYGHNLKYDAMVMQKYSIVVQPLSFDTMLAAYVLNPGSKVGLKNLAFVEFGIEMTAIEELIGSGKGQITFDQVPLEQAATYSCADADMTLRLVEVFQKRLKKPLS